MSFGFAYFPIFTILKQKIPCKLGRFPSVFYIKHRFFIYNAFFQITLTVFDLIHVQAPPSQNISDDLRSVLSAFRLPYSHRFGLYPTHGSLGHPRDWRRSVPSPLDRFRLDTGNHRIRTLLVSELRPAARPYTSHRIPSRNLHLSISFSILMSNHPP